MISELISTIMSALIEGLGISLFGVMFVLVIPMAFEKLGLNGERKRKWED